MIEARGAKNAYVYHYSAARQRGDKMSVNHTTIFDVADSDDEAYGRAMKAAHATYPQGDGWKAHFADVTPLDMDWIGRHDLSKIKAVEP